MPIAAGTVLDDPYKPPIASISKIEPEKSFQFSSGFVSIQLVFLVTSMAIYAVVVPEMGRMFEEFGVELPLVAKLCFATSAQGPLVLFSGFVCAATLACGIHLLIANTRALKSYSSAWTGLASVSWILFLVWTGISILLPFQSLIFGPGVWAQ